MGIDQWVKRTFHHRYPRAFEDPIDAASAGTADGGMRNSTPLPRAPIQIFDAINRFKAFPAHADPPIETGYDYFDQHILRDTLHAFMSGAHTVVHTYDRGSPEIKSIRHAQRYGKLVFPEEPPFSAGDLVTHTRLPPGAHWKEFVNHPTTRYDLLKYVTRGFISDLGSDPATVAEFGEARAAAMTFTPPPNTCVFVHGGALEGRSVIRAARDLPPHLYFVESAPAPATNVAGPVSAISRLKTAALQQQTCVRRCGRVPDAEVPEAHITQLLEGELACLYYANRYPGEDCTIVSVDGDLLLLLLLMARDRIDPNTGRFRNRHFLVLRMGTRDDEVVDVNVLYEDVMADPVFLGAGVADPVLALCALACLVKHDYIDKFAPNIGHTTMAALHTAAERAEKAAAGGGGEDAFAATFRAAGWPPGEVHRRQYAAGERKAKAKGGGGGPAGVYPDPSLKVPMVWALAFEQPHLLRNLVRASAPSMTGMAGSVPRGDPHTPLHVVVNEDAFIAFTEALYVHKYRVTAAKQQKPPCAVGDVTFAMVRAMLLAPKRSVQNRAMPRATTRRFARQLLWVLRYWINGYRGSCVTESTFATYLGLPYYGWQVSPTEGCVSTERVSVVRPRDQWPVGHGGHAGAGVGAGVGAGAGEEEEARIPRASAFDAQQKRQRHGKRARATPPDAAVIVVEDEPAAKRQKVQDVA